LCNVAYVIGFQFVLHYEIKVIVCNYETFVVGAQPDRRLGVQMFTGMLVLTLLSASKLIAKYVLCREDDITLWLVSLILC